MLTVVDNGIKIKLDNGRTASRQLNHILWAAIIITILGLAMALGWVLIPLGSLMIVITLIITGGLKWYQNHHAPNLLTGGEIFISSKQFSHHTSYKTLEYHLKDTDQLTSTPQALCICDASGRILYQIEGFSDEKHVKVAQAILQGKSIQTQAKSIRLQE